MCGLIRTFVSRHSGLVGLSGSVAKTSRAANPLRPSARAAVMAASSMTVPRPTLTTVTSGLTLANTSALTALALTAMEESVSFHP